MASFIKNINTAIQAMIRGSDLSIENKKSFTQRPISFYSFNNNLEEKSLKKAKSIGGVGNFIANVDVPPFLTFFLYYSVFDIVSTPVSRLARRISALEGAVYDREGYEQPLYYQLLKQKCKITELIEEFTKDILVFGQAIPLTVEDENSNIQFVLVPPHQVQQWHANFKSVKIESFYWNWENMIVTPSKEDFNIYRLPSVSSKFFGESPFASFYNDLNALAVNRANFQEFLDNNSFFGNVLLVDDAIDDEVYQNLQSSLQTLSEPGAKYKSVLLQGVKKFEQLKQQLENQLSFEEKKQIAINAAQAVGYHYKFLEGTTDGLGQGEQITLMSLMKMDGVDRIQGLIADFFNEMVLPAIFQEDFEKFGLHWKPTPMQTLSDLDQVRIGIELFKEGAITAETLKTKYAYYKYSELEYDDKFRKFGDKDVIIKAGLLKQGLVAQTSVDAVLKSIAEEKEPERRKPAELQQESGDEFLSIDSVKSFSRLDKSNGLTIVDKYKSGIKQEKSLLLPEALLYFKQASYGFKKQTGEKYASKTERQKTYINNIIAQSVLDNVKAHTLFKESIYKTLTTLERDIDNIIDSFDIDNIKSQTGEVVDEVKGTKEEDFLAFISAFYATLESKYNNTIFPYLLEVERALEAIISSFYNEAETDENGVIVFNSYNSALLDRTIARLTKEQEQIIAFFLEENKEFLMQMPSEQARNLLLILGIQSSTVDYALIDYSFSQGLISNIEAFFTNEIRRLRERLVDTFTQKVKKTDAVKSIKPISFNKNIYKTSALEHSKGVFRAVIHQAAKEAGVKHYRTYVPTQKLEDVISRPNGETVQTLFDIKTEKDWNKLGNTNPNVVGGLGLHHNSYEFYLPIPNNYLSEANALTPKLKSIIK